MPTTVTKSIGTSSRDYTTVQAWEDACPADLVTADQIWRGECYNDSEFTVSGTVLAVGGMTVDATRYMELTAAAGQSFVDHADKLTNARKYDASKGVGLRATNAFGLAIDNGGGVNYCRFSRLQLQGGTHAAGTTCVYQENSTDNDWNQCIFAGPGETRIGGTGTRIRNSLVIADKGGIGLRLKYGADAYNCTIVWPSDVTNTGTVGINSNDSGNVVQNCAVFGFATASSGTFDTTNSKNNATDLGSIVGASGNQVSKTYANQFQNTTTAARDFRPKLGADTIDTGVTDATNAADDLIGTARPSGAAYDIGAEEYIAAGGGGGNFPPFFNHEPTTHLRM